MEELGIGNMQLCPVVCIAEEGYLWTYEVPDIDMYLLNLIREERKTADLLSAFTLHVRQCYAGYVQIYTDGSKDPLQHTTGSVVCIPGAILSYIRLPGSLCSETDCGALSSTVGGAGACS